MAAAKQRKIYLTTPLYYVNGQPHLGHAYTTILTDFLARQARQRGWEFLFLTGTDEHGEKIVRSAENAGLRPQEYVDKIAASFQETWKSMGISNDLFYRTTSPEHYQLVGAVLDRLKAQGDIYFAEYEGKYCVGCERFRTDQEWNEQGLCPDHLIAAETRKESNYFFNMEKYRPALLKFYKENPDSIRPSQYYGEAVKMLEAPLEGLSISRPVERLSWGIPFPFDKAYVTYVWFDALLNYLGGIGYKGGVPSEEREFKSEFWAEVHHQIGKDILKTHAIYWPTMLLAMGFKPFRALQVGGFWLTEGQKMSKSLGNVIDPLQVQKDFGNEPFRYFLLREMSFGGDSSFSLDGFIKRCNAELANGLGNLTARTLSLVHKYLDAQVPPNCVRREQDHALLNRVADLPRKFLTEVDALRFHMAIGLVNESIAECDRYINEEKPWALGKDPTKRTELEAVLGTVMDALYVYSVLLDALMPEACERLRMALGQPSGVPSLQPVLGPSPLKSGDRLGEVPRLFPRIEEPAAE